MKTLFCFLASLAACITPCLSPQEPVRSVSNLVGEWRGTSVCQVREGSCHDEDSLYHVAHITGKPNWFSLKGDKIVDGKLITMGTVECHYASATSDLTCNLPKGLLHFTIQGNKMEGAMALVDGTLWRKLKLTKAPSTMSVYPNRSAPFVDCGGLALL